MFDTVAGMNTPTKAGISIEHHCLQLRYAPLRLHKRSLLNNIVESIESHGQRVPVVVVPSAHNQWVLMDGYLRVNALRRLGKDTVYAEVWQCEPADALLMLLTEHQSRTWEALEEALLLRELHTQHELSQDTLATRMGRDQSWVSRRLSLVDALPESMLLAICQGKLSLWNATRVLVPMARAIPAHAECLLQHMLTHPLSTREVKNFYAHYQCSTKVQRNKMLNEPDLFFKAQKLVAAEKQARVLQAGPEGKWQSQLHLVKTILTSLTPLASHVFMPKQETHERAPLLTILQETQTQFHLLTQTVRGLTDAHERPKADDYQFAPKGKQ